MSYILIPQVVSDKTALIWVGAVDENVRTKTVSLEYNVTGVPKPRATYELKQSEWRTWKTRNPLERTGEGSIMNVIHYQRFKIGIDPDLSPHTQYTIWLQVRDKGETHAANASATSQDYGEISVEKPVEFEDYRTKATVTTLPAVVPSKSAERPFTIMLGSCFYLPNDPQGMVGHTFLKLPPDAQPDIKFLCGDQVYLDNPWKDIEFFKPFMPKDEFRRYFFRKYLETWTQARQDKIVDENGVPVKDDKGNDKTKVVGGFNALLRYGANYFCSDDHEFWNNAPNVGGVGLLQTLLLSQRRWWFREASELFRMFQSLSPWMTFDVPPISVCIADTRINRTRHAILRGKDPDAQFMEADDLEAIGEWIDKLKGPGILVLGQLLMTTSSGGWRSLLRSDGRSIFERIGDLFTDYADFGLPGFPKQYDRLISFIKKSKHSIVLLTGDVHFGRLSTFKVGNDGDNSDVDIVEVVSSPMSVVKISKKKMGWGKYGPAPKEIFGTDIRTMQIGGDDNGNQRAHFVTLEFRKTGQSDSEVEMKVRSWPILNQFITDDNEHAKAVEVATITLK